MRKEEKYFHLYNTSASEFYYQSFDAVDKEGWTVRHVEENEQGALCLTNELIQIGDAILPEASIYPLEQIISSGFMVDEISKDEFERKWNEAIEYARENKLRPFLTGVIY